MLHPQEDDLKAAKWSSFPKLLCRCVSHQKRTRWPSKWGHGWKWTAIHMEGIRATAHTCTHTQNIISTKWQGACDLHEGTKNDSTTLLDHCFLTNRIAWDWRGGKTNLSCLYALVHAEHREHTQRRNPWMQQGEGLQLIPWRHLSCGCASEIILPLFCEPISGFCPFITHTPASPQIWMGLEGCVGD